MMISSSKIKDFNTSENKEYLTTLYDKCHDLKEGINLQIKDYNDKEKTYKILQKILDNIIKNKENEMYRILKFSNTNLKNYILSNKCIIEFLSFIGFAEIDIDNEKCLVLINLDENVLDVTLSTILLLLQDDSRNFFFKSGLNSFQREGYNEEDQTINSVNEDEKKQNFYEDLKRSRDNYISQNPPLTGPSNPNFGKIDVSKILKDTADKRRMNSNENYINNKIEYKTNIKNTNPNNRIITLNDINNNYSSNPIISNDWNSNKPSIKSAKNDKIGVKCLELTNEFRKRNNLPPLKWDDEIWTISYGHSKNMGEKKVPFSHEGFNNRINSLKFYFKAAFENVFYCHGYYNDVSELAVNGWINSPGHRKNLLSNSSHCAIATYLNGSGETYLTQIFIKK